MLQQTAVRILLPLWFMAPLFAPAQERAPCTITLKVGAGSSLSTRLFFTNETEFNQPASPFLNIGLSTNVRVRERNSLYIGLEMQGLAYYPFPEEKTNLGFVSLQAGRTGTWPLSDRLYLRQTNGISINTLIEATSSNPSRAIYTGGPARNLGLGAFSTVQVFAGGQKRKNRHIDYGLGIDFAFQSVQLLRDHRYPDYLHQNPFFQYGLSVVIRPSF